MLCPQCDNYLTAIAVAGEAVHKCSTCDYQRREPDLIVHATRIGIIPTREQPIRKEDTESKSKESKEREGPSVSEEMARRAAEFATDPTLYMPPNYFCPKCGSDTKVDIGRDKMYMFICPQCKVIVTPVSKPPGFVAREGKDKDKKT